MDFGSRIVDFAFNPKSAIRNPKSPQASYNRPVRLIITSDLHYNHRRSRPLADEVIDRINRAGGDVLLVVGDTAVPAGDDLEQCLSRFRFNGPKLFVAGNHELWTLGGDSHDLFRRRWPARVHALGWQWLQTAPFVAGDVAIVGSVGWYDYTFAQANLNIPRRFYEAKISPGAAERFSEYRHLFADRSDILPPADEVVARWNDGRFVKLGMTDDDFLAELLTELREQLDALREQRQIIAATHHLQFPELLPPPHSHQWDFAKAFLGSEQIGRLLLRYPNITHAFCGHSHRFAAAQVRHIFATNLGSGYRMKSFETLDVV